MLPAADLEGHQPLRIEGELRNVGIHVCDCTSILAGFRGRPSLEHAVQQDRRVGGNSPSTDDLLTGGRSPNSLGTRMMLFVPSG